MDPVGIGILTGACTVSSLAMESGTVLLAGRSIRRGWLDMATGSAGTAMDSLPRDMVTSVQAPSPPVDVSLVQRAWAADPSLGASPAECTVDSAAAIAS